MKMLTRWMSGLLVVAGLLIGAGQVRAQGTAFTYQGRLNANGVGAAGLYDFTFALYNASSGGSQAGVTLTNLAVVVTNGLFTVTEDFGAQFNGTSYWLQIAARSNNSGTFNTFSTRQPLTPAPYAIYAENSGASALISDQGSDNFFAGVSSGDSAVAGSHNTGVGYGTLPVNVSGSYNTASGASSLGANSSGTANTGDGVFTLWQNTTGGNNTALGADAMAYNTTGGDNTAVGIGALEENVSGSNNVAIGADAMVYSTADVGIVAIGYQALQNDAFAPGFFGSSASVAVGYQALQACTTGGFNTAIGYDSMYSATSALINTAVGINSLYAVTTGGNNIGLGGGAGGSITTGSYNIDLGNSGSNGDNALIRIGTVGSQTDAYIAGEVHTGYGLNVDQSGLNTGIVGSNALHFGIASGEGIASKRNGTNPFDLEFFTDYANRMIIQQGGNIGMGTTNPSQALEVNGNYVLVDGSGAYNGAGAIDAYIGGNGSGSDVQIGSFNSSIANVAFYNQGNNSYMHLYCSAITINGGSDLAEPFNVTSSFGDVAQGSVVVIDDENPGRLKVSNQAYDTRVAGVLSGANGVHPGIQMEQQGLLEGGKNVALSGRVYVLADASNGAIKSGDLLTTSATPGHAMKVTNHAKAAGAILGKAMTGLKTGQGMVLVLVSLQ